ncbi:MAG: fibronectin type III domain-containing protein [Parvularculales bacterium]
MLRRLGSQPFPLPILLSRGEIVIQLSEIWELTRGELESYDAYAALVAYNPDWATVAAENASITTVAFSVAGFLGPFVSDMAATSAAASGTETTQSRTVSSGGGNVYFYTAPAYPNRILASQTSQLNLSVGDAVSITKGTETYNYTITAIINTYGNETTVFEVGGDTDPGDYFQTGDSLTVVFTVYTHGENLTSYNTTDAAFKKTTDRGTSWETVSISDAALTNNATAVFVPPSAANTSLQMRTYLDTGETYNANNTYYFYNGTDVREVTAFSKSVEAVVKLTNYRLDDTAPAELSFMDAVISGTLPVDLVISHVGFSVDLETDTRKARIPIVIVLSTPVPAPLIGNGLITVNWDAVSDAEGYWVYYRQSGADWVQIPRSDDTALTELFTPLTNDTLYEFQVVAYGVGYQDSLPGEAFGAPAFENPYEAWMSNNAGWLVDGKVWVLPNEETETFEAWKLGNETWVIGDDTWVIDKW